MLYIDIGNSSLKAAEKVNLDWVDRYSTDISNKEGIAAWLQKIPADTDVAVVSVRRDILELVQENLNTERVRWITNKALSAFELDYSTPKTLGMDRFLACLGACAYTNSHVVVIDSGSACTIDMMTGDRVYQGGVIMPGLQLFHSAVEQNLPQLPNTDRAIPRKFPGKSTSECLEWGVNGSYVAAIREFTNRFLEKSSGADVYISGGDAEFLIRHLGDEFDAKIRRHLVFDGMKELLKLMESSKSTW